MSNNNGTTETIFHTNGTGEEGAGEKGALLTAAPDLNAGTVRAADIVGEMQTAYLDYAMSVIVARALPDVRDGLKPVHRRILYAMYHDLSLTHDKPHKKSARIVGEVLGKYHPHGDVAVYDAMVRMAQDFSLRYPLIDGQGNFGSIDGDNAAAMRYTEARLAAISDLMLEDLDRDTVGWHPNFDNTLREPDILPAALPNLLINGASGIAVGMATNVPPHNLGEIVDALAYMIDHYQQVDDITVEQLMEFVKGPDFPTGGILYRYREDKADENTDAIAQGYAVGKSRLILQAKAHFEEMSRGRMRIVVTELPYQTNKTALIERIASLTREEKLQGLTDLRDESDRTGMRIVIELNRNADPKTVLSDLFKYTPLQQTFGMQLLALVDNQPRLLSLKRALHLFIQHREEIVRRRSEFELAKARERAHIVEGLLHALDILDEVIDTIRRSQNVDTARANLVKNFKFSEVQAQAILDMQLRRLAALERKKLKDEFDELKKRIKYLEELLADPAKILRVIKEELLALREKYADARRTQIVDRTKGTLTTTDLLPQQDVWVAVNTNGDLMRQDVVDKPTATNLRQLGKGGQVALLTANTRDWLYLFTKEGRCARISVHEIPQDGNPKHLSELCGFTRRDAITAAVTLPRTEGDPGNGYLFFVTVKGMVKRVTLADFMAQVAPEFVVINVDEGDRLGWALPTRGDAEIILVTAFGQSIRFGEEDVRSMGLAAAGVGGIKLAKNDTVVYAGLVEADGSLVTMTTQGYAKQSPLADYSRQGRNGSGIVTHKPTSRTGDVATALVLPAGLDPETPLLVSNQKAGVKTITVAEIPPMGRGVQGKQVIEVSNGERIVGIKRLLDKTLPLPPSTPVTPLPTPEPVKGSTNGATKRAAPVSTPATAATPTTNGKAVETTPAQPATVAAQPTPAAPTSGRRNFVAAQSTPPVAQKTEDQSVATRPKADPPVTKTEATPVRQRAVTTPAERTADAPKPTKAGATANTDSTAKGKVPVSAGQPMPTPLKMKASTATTPVERQHGKGSNGREPIKAESAAPPTPDRRKTTVEPTPPSRTKLAPAQATLPVGQEALEGKVEHKEATREKPTEPMPKPAKAAPTEARPLKLTAPKATADNGIVGGRGKTVEESTPPKAGKQPKEAPVAQTLELFPVDATEAPKNTPSKLKIAVSVNRPAPKK
ncbi:MAG: DNA gyrase subunit A [Caldilinea sp. CFX5]|nr:DNA gyrase subunit A [Caldilinea sp. CFX5]